MDALAPKARLRLKAFSAEEAISGHVVKFRDVASDAGITVIRADVPDAVFVLRWRLGVAPFPTRIL